MGEPGPESPLWWPEAEAVGGRWGNLPGTSFDGWYVLGKLPPEPFLKGGFTPYREWPRHIYGPPGTVWVFQTWQVVERLSEIDPRAGTAVLRRLLRKLGRVGPIAVPLFFPIPNTYGGVRMPMRYINSTIIGKIGNDEQVAHTLRWRTPTENADLDIAQVQGFANTLRDRWAAYLNAAGVAGAGNQIRAYLPTTLEYTEVRAAYIEQTTPDQVKPPYLVRTQYAPIAPGAQKGTSPTPLPYEVAAAISLNTNFRGPRFRGRLYLGPLGTNCLGNDGNFAQNVVNRLGAAFWTEVVVPVEAAGWELHVVSRKYVTSARIIGCRMGIVPDSQRSRRRARPEGYTQVGGVAMGAA